MQPNNGTFEKRIRYFLPNELLLLVQTDRDPSPSEWDMWLENLLISFDIELPSRLSLATGNDLSPIIPFSIEERRYFTLHISQNKTASDDTLIAYIDIFSDRINYIFEEISLVAVAPNWLFAASQGQLIGGGPGGIPVPPSTPPPPDAHLVQMPQDVDRILQQNGFPTSVAQSEESCPVDVVIFDAVPPEDVWVDAVKQNWFNSHVLLRELHPKLNIIRSRGVPLQIPSDDVRNGYAHEPDYAMTDHGLFIAGLVYSMAPGARIHLVEVLNRYGAGTLDGLIRALVALMGGKLKGVDVSNNRSIILNLSLTISFRSPEDSLKARTAYEDLTHNFPNWAHLFPHSRNQHIDYVASLVEILRLVLEALKRQFGNRIVILAAAGNDGFAQSGNRYEARYPAAFDEVIGVGALKMDGTPAFYSNIADKPVTDGLTTFGGDARQVATLKTPLGNDVNLTDDDYGILGIYLGEFPEQNATDHFTNSEPWKGTVSVDGWGRWSGTSFATGVESAGFAKALCAGMSPFSTEQGELGLYNALLAEDGDVSAKGN